MFEFFKVSCKVSNKYHSPSLDREGRGWFENSRFAQDDKSYMFPI